MEKSSFKLIVITQPVLFPGELTYVEALFKAGLQRLHFRKPGATEEEIGAFLQRLSPEWYPRLVLQGQPELARQLGIGRLHMSLEPWREYSEKAAAAGTLSTSLHSMEELETIESGDRKHELEYVYVSPLFDSISKKGYLANVGLLAEVPALKDRTIPVIGLGGIGKDNIAIVKDHGWDGAALLGYIWDDPKLAVTRFEELQNIIGD